MKSSILAVTLHNFLIRIGPCIDSKVRKNMIGCPVSCRQLIDIYKLCMSLKSSYSLNIYPWVK